jgi:opacity protein-like surface antigen
MPRDFGLGDLEPVDVSIVGCNICAALQLKGAQSRMETRMKPITYRAATAILALLAPPAIAGNVEAVVVEPAPVPVTPVAPVAPAFDWTGGYVGGSLGFLGADAGANLDDDDDDDDDDLIDLDFDGDGAFGGLRLGYDYAFANGFLLGGLIGYDAMSIDVDGDDDTTDADDDTLNSIARAGVRAGYAFGPNLVYGTGGYAHADTDDSGSSEGYFVGAGAERFITQNLTAGLEVLYHEFDNFDDDELEDIEAEATSIGLTLNYRF